MINLSLTFELESGQKIELQEGDIIVDKWNNEHIVQFGTVTHTEQGHGECSTTVCCGLYFSGWGRMEGIKKL